MPQSRELFPEQVDDGIDVELEELFLVQVLVPRGLEGGLLRLLGAYLAVVGVLLAGVVDEVGEDAELKLN